MYSLFTSKYRQAFASSRDGILPEMFSGVHVTFKTPMPAVLLHVRWYLYTRTHVTTTANLTTNYSTGRHDVGDDCSREH